MLGAAGRYRAVRGGDRLGVRGKPFRMTGKPEAILRVGRLVPINARVFTEIVHLDKKSGFCRSDLRRSETQTPRGRREDQPACGLMCAAHRHHFMEQWFASLWALVVRRTPVCEPILGGARHQVSFQGTLIPRPRSILVLGTLRLLAKLQVARALRSACS